MIGESVIADVEVSAVVDADNPWPGLASFREADEAFFRGRDRDVDELRRVVQSQRLTVLFGASGLGKTSLLRAGLFPRLRTTQEFPIYLALDFKGKPAELRQQVFAQVLLQTAEAQVEAPAARGSETLWDYLHRRDASFWNDRNRLLTPVLIFDQFEDVFSRGLQDDAWAIFACRFLDELSDLIEGRPPAALKQQIEDDAQVVREYEMVRHRYRIVLSLREDYLAALEDLRDRMPSIAHGRVRLQPMNGKEAFQVVDQTKGRLIETHVAEKVVRFAAAKDLDDTRAPLGNLQIDPSLLSLFCRELNNRRKDGHAERITEDLVRASQADVLEDFYERSMETVVSELRRFVEDELLTSGGQRDSRAFDDALLEPGVTAQDITRLVNARLLRIEERAGVRRIELAHDVLTKVARASRDRRKEVEAAAAEKRKLEVELRADQERERQARLEAEILAAREQQTRLVAKARATRILKLLLVAILVLALFALFQWRKAMRYLIASQQFAQEAHTNEQNAINSAGAAKAAGELAEARLQRIIDGIKLKQAVLSGNHAQIDQYLASDLANRSIAFGVKAINLGHKIKVKGVGVKAIDLGHKIKAKVEDKQQFPVYRFSLFPEENSVPGGLESLVAVTFRMDHASFDSVLLTAGIERRFTAYYDGWGCLSNVIALIEYVDPDKTPEIARLDMCEILRNGARKDEYKSKR
jgi:hypothetical protein